jgi:hypothetical protein
VIGISKCSAIRKFSFLFGFPDYSLTENFFSTSSMIETLPDKGAKLQETNQIIEQLLLEGKAAVSCFDEVTAENTNNTECPLTKRLESMSVYTPHQGARKRSVDLANQQAFSHYTSSGLLLRKPKKMNSPPSIFYNIQQSTHHGSIPEQVSSYVK